MGLSERFSTPATKKISLFFLLILIRLTVLDLAPIIPCLILIFAFNDVAIGITVERSLRTKRAMPKGPCTAARPEKETPALILPRHRHPLQRLRCQPMARARQQTQKAEGVGDKPRREQHSAADRQNQPLGHFLGR